MPDARSDARRKGESVRRFLRLWQFVPFDQIDADAELADTEQTFWDLRAAPDPSPHDALESAELVTLVRAALAELPPAERDLMSRRWGIGARQESLDALAARYGVTRSQLITIEGRTRRYLRARILWQQGRGEYVCWRTFVTRGTT